MNTLVDKIIKNINLLSKEKYFYTKLNKEEIEKILKYEGCKLSESMFRYVYNITEKPKCPKCGKELPFFSFKNGYQKYCSKSCRAKSLKHTKESIEKMKKSSEKHFLEKFGVKNPFQLDKVKKINSNRPKEFYEKRKEKIINTNRKKYGVDWANQNEKVLSKRSLTNILKYGNSCSLHGDNGILSDPKIFEKSQSFNRKKHEIFVDKLLSDAEKNNLEIISKKVENESIIVKCKDCGKIFSLFLRNVPKCSCKMNYKTSKKENEIYNFLKNEIDDTIIKNDRIMIKPYELDIYLPKFNLAIEYNGSYWHSINNANHYRKLSLCKNNNIDLIQIFDWQYDLYEKQIKDNIIKFLIDKTYYDDFFIFSNTENIKTIDLCWPIPKNYEIFAYTKPKKIFLKNIINSDNDLFYYDCGSGLIRKKIDFENCREFKVYNL